MGVRVYDDVLPDSFCKGLVNFFEQNQEHHQFISNHNCPCFTQINVNQISMDIVQVMLPHLIMLYDRYREDINNHYGPDLKSLEEFRIKRYNTSGDERFDEHVDVTNPQSAMRAVAFLFYLNDNDGNTVFTNQNLSISPSSGKVVVFPPTWEYPHAGLPPSTNSKYILSTYIHYGS